MSTAQGEATVTVTWSEPSVTYAFDPAPTVTSSHQSGDVFPIGTTTVTYTAVYSLGVVSNEEFIIRVLGKRDILILLTHLINKQLTSIY